MRMVRLRPPSPGGAAKRSTRKISQHELLHLCQCQQRWECLLANRIAKHLCNMGMVRLRPPSLGGAANRSAKKNSQHELLHVCHCQQCWECLLANRIAKHLCNMGMARLRPPSPGGAAKRSAGIISQHELLHLCELARTSSAICAETCWNLINHLRGKAPFLEPGVAAAPDRSRAILGEKSGQGAQPPFFKQSISRPYLFLMAVPVSSCQLA